MQPLVDLPVVGYEGLYTINQSGIVKSVRRTVKGRNGFFGGHVKATVINKYGYEQVSLYRECRQKNLLVHRLVAITFIPNPKNLPEVNHKDLDKSNNKVSNLEWVSREQNLTHAAENGRRLKGELLGNSILTEKDVLEIVDLLDKGLTYKQIGDRYNVGLHAIYRIAKGLNWSWLTEIDGKVGEECSHS